MFALPSPPPLFNLSVCFRGWRAPTPLTADVSGAYPPLSVLFPPSPPPLCFSLAVLFFCVSLLAPLFLLVLPVPVPLALKLTLFGSPACASRCPYLPTSDHRTSMTQWVGDNWRLRAGPQPDSTQDQYESTDDDTKVDPELRLRGYKESFVREYDGIRVYHHQGRYQHQTEQFHYWAFYEYRMMINGECWNIITDEDMVKPPSSFPGSNSAKLTHDFCHLESRYCDDEYTSFNFVDIAGHKIWPFYTSEKNSRTPLDLGKPKEICHHLRPPNQ